ncbi:hypothetical protein SERLA73DRAFT_71585 [Serpula lacrymans var. lacrymans S7.3]|uniref:C2H2-type domain-containing protein n=2 Tax=Serpula lacrymans var. lacrymans TaxID=341189 RepID=F8PRF0_SERL3|nr:uncharacterized protein SERLADRAFT_435973 [Serpula lacrymans var. lacrymans S7.9]EGO00573.1 hypothetical protein SERLA73DRAFT_71585 [Serpula lacrymans var. lacrymans S7.3]EGO26128.1 hypothetical protein SERLADRAFT_435973 [Serpula lacrymans var. lacrymans S7.9]
MSFSMDFDIDEFMNFNNPDLFDENMLVSHSLGTDMDSNTVPQHFPIDDQVDLLPHYVGDAGVKPNEYPANYTAPTSDVVGWPVSRTVHSIGPADQSALPLPMFTDPWAPRPSETLDEAHHSISIRMCQMLNDNVPPHRTAAEHSKIIFNALQESIEAESDTDLVQALCGPVDLLDYSDTVLGEAQSEGVPPMDIGTAFSEGSVTSLASEAQAYAAAYAADMYNENRVLKLSCTDNAAEVIAENDSHAFQNSYSVFNQDGFTSAAMLEQDIPFDFPADQPEPTQGVQFNVLQAPLPLMGAGINNTLGVQLIGSGSSSLPGTSKLADIKFVCRWGLEPCGKPISKNNVKKHLTRHHGLKLGLKDAVRCEWEGCNRQLLLANISRHIATLHLPICLVCSACGQEFPGRDAVWRHIVGNHPGYQHAAPTRVKRHD